MRSLETTTIAAIEVSKNNTAAQCVLQIYLEKAHKNSAFSIQERFVIQSGL